MVCVHVCERYGHWSVAVWVRCGQSVERLCCLLQALYLLLQCAHNVEEALRRRKMQAVPPSGLSLFCTDTLTHSKQALSCTIDKVVTNLL